MTVSGTKSHQKMPGFRVSKQDVSSTTQKGLVNKT